MFIRQVHDHSDRGLVVVTRVSTAVRKRLVRGGVKKI